MWKKRVVAFLNEFELYIGALLLFAMLILLTTQVITRYIFNFAFTWTEELSTVMFIWLAYLGASAAVRKGQHLRIDLVLNMLKGRAKKALLIVTDLITMAFCLIMIPPMMNILDKLTRQGSVTLMLRIPKNLIFWVLPIALVLITLRFAQKIYGIAVTPESQEPAFAGKSIFDGIETEPAAAATEKEAENRSAVLR